MEHQKILDLLNEPNDSKFGGRKWNIFNDQSNANYDVRKQNYLSYRSYKINLFDYQEVISSLQHILFQLQ